MTPPNTKIPKVKQYKRKAPFCQGRITRAGISPLQYYTYLKHESYCFEALLRYCPACLSKKRVSLVDGGQLSKSCIDGIY